MKSRATFNGLGCVLRGIVVAVLAWMATAAWAGPPDQPADKDQPAQDQPLSERQELRAIRDLEKAALEELRLSDEQARAVHDLFEEHFEDMKEVVRRMKDDREKNARRMKELREELERVKGDRDIERIRAIRMEMRELDSGRMQIRRAGIELDTKVIALLSEEQASQYRRLSARYRYQMSPDRRSRQGIWLVHRVLRDIELTEEQREAVQRLTAEAAGSFAEARADMEKREQATAEFREKVLAVLTEEQRKRFTELEVAERQKQEAGPNVDRPSKPDED